MKRLLIFLLIALASISSHASYIREKKLVEADELRKLTATIGDSTVEAQRDHYMKLYKIEVAKNKSLSTNILLLILIFLVISVSTVLVVRSRMKMRGIDAVRRIAELFIVSAELGDGACRKTSGVAPPEVAETECAKIEIGRLFRERWSELNIMCNEYFEMEDSPAARLSVVRNIERELEKMRTPRNIRLIVDSVNLYMDGIVSRLETECLFLKAEDLTFLALAFARFSPRAVCMFTGIKLKYYYNKRSRLAAKIKQALGDNADPYLRLLDAKAQV